MIRRIILNLRIAIRSLCSFRLRSSLAVLGVFLGTFSLIIVSNLSDSLALKTDMDIAQLGKNLLIVRNGLIRNIGHSSRLFNESTTLKVSDANAISQTIGVVSGVCPASNKAFPLRYEGTSLGSILTIGVSPDFPDIRNFHAEQGRFFTNDENIRGEKVVVLGSKVAEKLFGTDKAIGRTILLYRVPCLVIGVMESKGVDMSNVDQDNQIFMPLNTFLRRFVNKDYISTIFVQVSDEEHMAQAKKMIEDLLRSRHSPVDGKDDFTVIDQKDLNQMKSQAMSIIILLGRIAAVVSFLIGGIGILSIMILIVNERKVEIGIRRAVGARRRDIALQFLLESSFISFMGGFTGVSIGFFMSALIFKIMSLPFSFSILTLAMSFAISVIVGIIAGIYPAQRAVVIQPVDIMKG